MIGEKLPSKQDIYYILSIIFIVSFFGIWIIPQITRLLINHTVSTWLIILIDCIILPIIALSLLWLIIQEIQEHYKNLDFSDSDKEIEESFLINETFSEEDEKFIEEKMREKLEKDQFEDDMKIH